MPTRRNSASVLNRYDRVGGERLTALSALPLADNQRLFAANLARAARAMLSAKRGVSRRL